MTKTIASRRRELRALEGAPLEDFLRTKLASASAASNLVWMVLKGRTVEVISDFNDQQFGRSKKSLKGKRFEITNAFTDGGEIVVWLKGCDCGAELWKDVKLI